MYPGYAKESPIRAFTRLLGDDSVRRLLHETQIGSVFNRAIGHQDRFYLALRRLIPNGGRFFSQGWGDLARAEEVRAEILECVSTRQFHLREIINPVKTHETLRRDCRIMTYQVTSPWAHWLPQESETLYFQIVEPIESPQAFAFHLPCTGDEGFEYRREQVAKGLLHRRIASIIPMIPYYGHRRPVGQDRWYVRTVADFLIQLSVGFIESLALHNWFREFYPHSPLVFTGFSLGGAMAASAACALNEGPYVALAPCLSSLTAEAMCDGAISLNISWSSLGGSRGGDQETREQLYQLADRFGVQAVIDSNPVNRVGSLHQLVASEDVIVDERFGEALYQALAKRISTSLPNSYACLETIPGGHGTAMIAAGQSFGPAIIRALEHLSP